MEDLVARGSATEKKVLQMKKRLQINLIIGKMTLRHKRGLVL